MRALPVLCLFALAACGDFTPAPKEPRYDAATGQIILPPCPDWSHPSVGNYDNSMHSNYGCAVNRNMAVQVEQPSDWEKGYGQFGPDTETTLGVVSRYRSGELPEPLVPQQGGN